MINFNCFFVFQFRGIENNLTILLKEIEENLEWISDTEMLIKPASDKEVVEVDV